MKIIWKFKMAEIKNKWIFSWYFIEIYLNIYISFKIVSGFAILESQTWCALDYTTKQDLSLKNNYVPMDVVRDFLWIQNTILFSTHGLWYIIFPRPSIRATGEYTSFFIRKTCFLLRINFRSKSWKTRLPIYSLFFAMNMTILL